MFELPSFFLNKNKFQSHKKVCENKFFCNIMMPSEDTKMMEFNHHQKVEKAPLAIYAGLECLIEKIYRCKNDSLSSSWCLQYHHLKGK